MQNTPVLCISTSFQVHAAPKSWLNYFYLAVFNLFCSFKTFFSDFTAEINKKCLKRKQKKVIFVYTSKLVNMQKLGPIL